MFAVWKKTPFINLILLKKIVEDVKKTVVRIFSKNKLKCVYKVDNFYSWHSGFRKFRKTETLWEINSQRSAKIMTKRLFLKNIRENSILFEISMFLTKNVENFDFFLNYSDKFWENFYFFSKFQFVWQS